MSGEYWVITLDVSFTHQSKDVQRVGDGIGPSNGMGMGQGQYLFDHFDHRREINIHVPRALGYQAADP